MRSVTVGTSTSAIFTASASSRLAHRLVVEIEPRVEQLAHARFDAVRQLARDDDQRLFAFGHFSAFRRSAWPAGRIPDVQASLTAPAETAEASGEAQPATLYQMVRVKTKRHLRWLRGVQMRKSPE